MRACLCTCEADRRPAFYAPFCVLGTPITILIKRFSAARVLPIMAAGFGGISLLSAAAKNFGGIMTLRILLAVSEAACLPGGACLTWPRARAHAIISRLLSQFVLHARRARA